MPYAVGTCFDEFRKAIELSGDHRETAAKRRDRLVSLLGHNFEILESFTSGSIPRYTALDEYADLDIIVVFHYGKHIKGLKPSQVLQAVKDCLSDYKTSTRRNGQAVTLYYDTWPNVDIVPVSRSVDNNGNISHYNVPDMNTETWIVSKPKAHDTEMTTRNQNFGEEFKRLVKMIKWWNKQHSDIMQSYHIEILGLEICTGKFSDYPWNVYQFFDKAYDLTEELLYHNDTCADYYLTEVSRNELRKHLDTAREMARNAWYLTYGENAKDKDAIEIWRRIFGDKFPDYG